ncbi:hypothetical protein Q73_07095 [Bacillus coahuilensis m2-6]|uniref:histidine phosphatase family protein n=2 Tax=Bacillus coahuilensis TaxID=408580 RepID=UPI000750202F|nr:histidine phosphatase family protein [Bacillus coahuilensis]KUP08126.1 hypothetical protein Q73_07095 [Bacillus coahuilensis m2-6]
MGNTFSISLLRHGMTLANVEKKYIGWQSSSLLKTEVARLSRLAPYMKRMDSVSCSDLVRAIETAQLVVPNKLIEKISEFRELHFGDWDGLTHHELQHNPNYQQWIQEPFNIPIPNGEHFTEFRCRVNRGFSLLLKEIRNKPNHHHLIVSHGGVMRVLLDSFAPASKKSFWEWDISHTVLYTLTWNLERNEGDHRCTLLQVEHLTEK